MNSLEQIKRLTQRKVSPCLFMKSKHTFPNYKNHEYFQKHRYKNVEENSQKLSSLLDSDKLNMFVNQPTDFGLRNTYQSFMKYNARKRNKTIEYFQQQKSKYSQKSKIVTQQNQYQKVTKSYISKLVDFHKNPNNDCSFGKLEGNNKKVKHILQLIYVPPTNSVAIDTKPKTIRLDLSPYIINCFIRCQIDFPKVISQRNYDYICRCIEEIFLSSKSPFNAKDIINIISMEKLMRKIQGYKWGSIQWTQIIRYFFVASETVAVFQYNKVLDEIRQLASVVYDLKLDRQKLCVYNADNVSPIKNLYDLLTEGTYVFGTDLDIANRYEELQKKYNQQMKKQKTIAEWKKTAKIHHPQCEPNREMKPFISEYIYPQTKRMSLQKLERISSKVKERRKRLHSQNRLTNSQKIETNQTINSFIDRSKLKKLNDLFE